MRNPALILITTVVALLATGLTAQAHAADVVACGKLLTAPDYKLELPDLDNVRCQSGGTCWLQAGLARLEFEVHAQTGQNVMLSEDYLQAMHLRGQALSRVRFGDNDPSAGPGGDFFTFQSLVNRVGAVPKEEFEFTTDWDALAAKLQRAAAPFRKRARGNPGQAEQIQSEAAQALDRVIEAEFGKFPKNFLFNGKSYTSLSFAREFVAGKNHRMVFVNKPNRNQMLGGQPLSKVFTLIGKQLKGGKAVYATFQWPFEWENSPDGLINFDQKLELNSETSGRHAVIIVGVDLDARGQVVAVKIQNSWGPEFGDNGYFHLSRKAVEQTLVSVILAE